MATGAEVIRPTRSTATLVLLFGSLAAWAGFLVRPLPPTIPPLLEGVPDVVQTTNYTCGPSSLVGILAYYGIPAEELAVARAAKTDPNLGAELEDLAAVAQSYGLEATVREYLTLADLEREISAGYPVLILNQSWREHPRGPWSDEWDDGHYVVVIGIDAERVFVEDPVLEGARGVIPRVEFVDRWHDWDRTHQRAWGQGLLVHGPKKQYKSYPIKHFERVR